MYEWNFTGKFKNSTNSAYLEGKNSNSTVSNVATYMPRGRKKNTVKYKKRKREKTE